MNAKKIMGAVLVALLAAALFVGAGAAADSKTDLGTVFVYENVTGLSGSWTLGENTLVATVVGDKGFFSGDNVVEGVYENATHKITVKYPTATITGLAEPSTAGAQPYMFIGGVLYTNTPATITVTSASKNVTVDKVFVTYPNGTIIANWTGGTDYNKVDGIVPGKYQLQAHFSSDNMTKGTPANYLYSKAVYTFTVVDSSDVTISANAESYIKGQTVTLTITGQPGKEYDINGTGFTILEGALDVTSDGKFNMPNTGKATVQVVPTKTGNIKISVADASVTISVIKGTITAKTDKESYFVGDDVTISGTSTIIGGNLQLYIAGTNVDFQDIGTPISVNDGKWEKKLTAGELKVKDKTGATGQKLDAGTYTIYISTNVTSAKTIDDLETYETVSLVMKQPFISVTDAPTVAVQGTDYTVTGTAEATEALAVYVFGTNFFAATNGADAIAGTIFNKDTVALDGNEFTVEFKVKDMAPGQYFMVIQHPMYDENFNIVSNASGDIIKNATGDAKLGGNKVFNVWERQTANAAQALCDELDLQNIDDMYVKLSFVVAAPSSTINPIPSEITQGSKLTISGTTNMGEGETVTVELLSTAFAAVPKETVGSASFVSLVTKTDEEGNWEVTFDTTSLNVDEYTVSVAVGALGSTTAKLNIVEGAPTEQPTTTPTEQPTQTEQPTEAPSTPGFGALAALAGLGAVAVLLLRRE